MSSLTGYVIRQDKLDGSMTQKTLAERFDELELEYQEVISTKYTG
ncbi:malate dehydrogenase, partial [Salmonella enterica subsp. enterica]|nr:malate dehydrogenase [Salmonella enterica subsp. enterica]